MQGILKQMINFSRAYSVNSYSEIQFIKHAPAVMYIIGRFHLNGYHISS